MALIDIPIFRDKIKQLVEAKRQDLSWRNFDYDENAINEAFRKWHRENKFEEIWSDTAGANARNSVVRCKEALSELRERWEEVRENDHIHPRLIEEWDKCFCKFPQLDHLELDDKLFLPLENCLHCILAWEKRRDDGRKNFDASKRGRRFVRERTRKLVRNLKRAISAKTGKTGNQLAKSDVISDLLIIVDIKLAPKTVLNILAARK
ncbi:MAG: hypothetical protein V1809_12125 [Planctomycetota bacterium]